MPLDAPLVRDLGLTALPDVWAEMQAFTAERTASDARRDLVRRASARLHARHASRPQSLAGAQDIPVVQIDRGGQVTYHGPGQLVAYVLLNLERRALTPRKLVQALENAVIDTVADYGVAAVRRGATRRASMSRARSSRPSGCASNGIARITGLAVNVAMDLTPYEGINPCGYEGLAVTDLRTLCGSRRTCRAFPRRFHAAPAC